MIRPTHIPARHWYAMSWHARDKATRRYLAALEAERPAPRPPAAVVVGPYSRLDHPCRVGLTPDVADALARTIGLLAGLLDEVDEARCAPHGTKAARERHRRWDEPLCDVCRAHSRVPVAPFEVAEMHRLASVGLTRAQIAARLDRGVGTVRDHLRSTQREDRAA